jgi:DNA mismatch repair protein MutL
MILIDQHRAHCRILYEDLLKSITVKAAVSQQLLFPLSLQLNAQETQMLQYLRESLEQTGFIFSKMEEEEIEITGIPTLIPESEVSILLDQLLSDFENEIPESGFLQTDLLAKSLAKSMAIKAGTQLDTVEQIAIVNGLFACKEPQLTPSNKKIFITLQAEDIEKKFM